MSNAVVIAQEALVVTDHLLSAASLWLAISEEGPPTRENTVHAAMLRHFHDELVAGDEIPVQWLINAAERSFQDYGNANLIAERSRYRDELLARLRQLR